MTHDAGAILIQQINDLKAELVAVTGQRDDLLAALTPLVAARAEKDAHGETPLYHKLKHGAWERAARMVGRFEP